MIKLRVPTRDQYAFVEVDGDWDSPETAKMAYLSYFEAFNASRSLSEDFCSQLVKIIDSDLTKGWGSVDEFKELPIKQQEVLQSLKKLKKRLNYHNEN